MSHVFTLKLPHPLLERLEETARGEGKSKGAFVREALEEALSQKSSPLNRIQRITETLRRKKKIRIDFDWDELRKKITSSSVSPEEEVSRSRRRGM